MQIHYKYMRFYNVKCLNIFKIYYIPSNLELTFFYNFNELTQEYLSTIAFYFIINVS